MPKDVLPAPHQDSFSIHRERIVLTQTELAVPGLRMLGRQQSSQATPALEPHYHKDAFEFVCLPKGAASFYVDDLEYHLTGGEVFVSGPGEVHHSGKASLLGQEMYWFQLDISQSTDFLWLAPAAADELIQRLKGLENRVIPAPQPGTQHQLQRLFSLAYPLPGDCFSLGGALVYFLQSLLRQGEPSRPDLTPDIVAARETILRQLSQEISLEELAAVSGLSLSHFKRKFKHQLGVTPREYINRKKIEQAKKELREEPHRTVTDIAMGLGFSSSNYFAVVFKQFTSYTPSQYRALMSAEASLEDER